MTTATTQETNDVGEVEDDEQYITYLVEQQALKILTRVAFHPMNTHTRVQHDNILSNLHIVFGFQTYIAHILYYESYMASRTEICVTRKLPRTYC
jgi:hypothetical protein